MQRCDVRWNETKRKTFDLQVASVTARVIFGLICAPLGNFPSQRRPDPTNTFPPALHVHITINGRDK